MERDYEPDLIARELRGVSSEVKVAGAFPEKKDGIQSFYFWTASLVTTDEIIEICRDMAIVIRREIPEKPDGWAASIYPSNHPPDAMGIYYIGWAGRSDEFELSEGQERKATDHADWLAFRNRLQDAVAAIGTEEKLDDDGGDFKVFDHESGGEKGPRKQTLFVNNPEFLTKELIATVQNVIRNSHPDGVVSICPAFGDPFDVLWDGIDVRIDGIEEKWDRRDAERLLGDRLKI